MTSVLRILDVDWQDLERHRDALAELDSGESFVGMIIRRVYSPEAMDKIVARAEAGQSGLPEFPSNFFPGRVFGRILPHEPPPLDAYFREAAMFREGSRTLFEGIDEPFQDRLEHLLGRLSGGRAIRVPVTASGQLYQPYSLREMRDGASINLHYEREAMDSPNMAEIRTLLARPHQLSCYLSVRVPESGGELSLYAVRGPDPRNTHLKFLDRKAEATYAKIESMSPRQPLLVGEGDVLLFDAGTYYHRVTTVVGKRSRWTMGTFVSLSRDRDAYYYFT
jgi:hypothetical protein